MKKLNDVYRDHVFARLGGDEFALWVEDYNSERLAMGLIVPPSTS